ncbi:cytoplasmic dynein 2 heavy chain 1-like [Convolutriloba macropyga]|uniref:cytoplasmic dynein 2 heavy chain 1-like n=1 Tax=Convolutriloba macropyga TaxID=536237 RepID=UPI003F51B50B
MDKDSDPRKLFFSQMLTGHFGNDKTLKKNLFSSKELNTFLDDGNCMVLLVWSADSNFYFSTTPLIGDVAIGKCVAMTKIRPDVIVDVNNIQANVIVVTIVNSPVTSLYHALHKLYAPLLSDKSSSSGGHSAISDSNLLSLVNDLDSKLAASSRYGESRANVSVEDESNVYGILRTLDEICYWKELGESPMATFKAKDRAIDYSKQFKNMEEFFQGLENQNLEAVSEYLPKIVEVLDAVWGITDKEPVYPEERMKHLIEVIGGDIGRFVQKEVAKIDCWKGNYHETKANLRLGVQICEEWKQLITKKCNVWRHDSLHTWKSPKVPCEGIIYLGNRLKEIMSCRVLHQQLSWLLDDTEQSQYDISSFFEPFHALDPVMYNPFTQPLWEAALQSFGNKLVPVEKHVARKMKNELASCDSKGEQLLQEYLRYQELIKRGTIKQELMQEREALLGQLSSFAKGLADEFDNLRKGRSKPKITLTTLPKLINEMNYVRMLQKRIESVSEDGEPVLGDLQGFPKFSSFCQSQVESMVAYKQELFDRWVSEILEAINDRNNSISLATTVKIMELDHKDGHLRVNFRERLVTLIREVRNLSAMGFTIPAKIQQTVQQGQKFYQYAMVLKQVANFYNTIDAQMIRCQQPMMLQAALAFENIVKNPKGQKSSQKGEKFEVTWDDPENLEQYIEQLQKAAETLSLQNRRLRKAHFALVDKVAELYDIDLLKREQHWRDTLKQCRKYFEEIESEGYKELKQWAAHWNHQIYKTFEHQYQLGLECINQNQPEIKVEIVFKQMRLQFSPGFEEIKSQYYRALRRFMSLPNHIRGMTSADHGTAGSAAAVNIFPLMIERNSSSFSNVFKKAENLLGNLAKTLQQFEPWVVLGKINLEELVQSSCQTVEDFDRNFKLVKTKGKEFEKLPLQIKLDCFVISCVPIRNAIEDLLQQLFDVLIEALKKSALEDVHKIDNFLTEALDTLEKRPQSVQEVTEANTKQHEYTKQKSELQPVFVKIVEKNRLLRMTQGQGVDEVNSLHARWDKFEIMMESFHMMIADQVEKLKENTEKVIVDFRQDIEKFRSRWTQFRPSEDTLESGDSNSLKAALKSVQEKQLEFDELLQNRDKLVEQCQQFGITIPDFPELDQLRDEIDEYQKNWSLFGTFLEGLEKMTSEDWISFRVKTNSFQDYVKNWKDRLNPSTLAGEGYDPRSVLVVKLNNDIAKYIVTAGLLKYLKGDSFSPDHWLDLYRLLGISHSIALEKLTLGDILGASETINCNVETLKELNLRAQGEVSIRDALRELDLWGGGTSFNLLEHNDTNRNRLMLIKDYKDLVNQVGDNQCLLQSLKDSPYYAAFEDKAKVWETRLADIDEYVLNLNQIQRKWLYLEPIFARGALPKEQARFRKVNEEFRGIMSDIERDSRVISLCNRTGLRGVLNNLLDQLQRCQKSLAQFLEEKRAAFPRFYFIGDDDLLEILGQATNPEVIQSHLKKLFQGINSVKFDDSKKSILAMCSLVGETVTLSEPVKISNDVEKWLSDLAREMKRTLALLLGKCISDFEAEPSRSVYKYPSQILCLAEQISFTDKSERALKRNGLDALMRMMNDKLGSFTNVDVSNASSSQDAQVLESKLKALILDCVHEIDVIKQLIQSRSGDVIVWDWQKQLRFYCKSSSQSEVEAYMKMVEAQFDYTYEYQGNAPKLVHSPLTDKCYLTLTQAMHLGLGGNPYGPAGTGKTESVKALGGLFGRQVLVFNCDEGIDLQSMGRIFIGIIKCGAWGCFDEFNRLEEAVLSAVSMQIQVIQAALKQKQSSLELMEREVDLDANSGIFITLNPAGKGYGGRQKLPDNLKQLFRPVAMSRPDNELISEVLLFAEGYKNASVLGRKLFAVFNLSKGLLTPQQHYDWGLRALKTVLKGCGDLLKKAKRESADDTPDQSESSIDETVICVQALRLNTLSKLTFIDMQRFEGIIKDVFPGIEPIDVSYEEIESAIKEACKEMHLQIMPRQVKKALELYEQLRQRTGVVVVGPSGAGKSTIWTMLQHALLKVQKKVVLYTMNPKAMPRQQLLGSIDLDTREWTDGVLTYSARQVVKEPLHVNSWIICDGDIDPEWIESLNSVLDDNRLLTMPSGERIQFGPNVNFLFETHDLSCASPATISRMGMIFLSDEDVNEEAVVSSWLSRHCSGSSQQQILADLESLVAEHFYSTLQVAKKFEPILEVSLTGLIFNGLSHLVPLTSQEGGMVSEEEFKCAVVKGFLGNVKDKEAFMREISNVVGFHPPGSDLTSFHFDRMLARVESYRDNQISDEISDEFEVSGKLPLVLTRTTLANLDNFNLWLQSGQRQPFILIGPEGCGKSMLLNHCFSQLRSVQIAAVYCSAQTSPEHILQKLNQSCLMISTNTGRVYRPKEAERMILYLKDINLPRPDKWATSQLIAFLQQVLTYNGFYDSNLEWVGLEAIQIVATMIDSTSMGRHKLTSRFTSIVRVASMGYLSNEELVSVLEVHFKHIFPHMMSGFHSQMAKSTVDVYKVLKNNFKSDEYSHYQFTPRDLTKWILSLKRFSANQSASSDSDELIMSWAFMGCRLFMDKLVGEESRSQFLRALDQCARLNSADRIANRLRDRFYSTFTSKAAVGLTSEMPASGKPVSFLPEDSYSQIVERGIEMYERDNKELNLSLFSEVLETMSKVDVALSMPGGSLLMAGRSGVGRRSTVHVVANMHAMEIFTPKISRNYGLKQFKNDLKICMQKTGIENEQLVFIMEDWQLIDSHFLEYINSLLASGEVAGLYTPEELEPLLSPLRERASEEGYQGTIFSFFAKRVQANMHVVLIFDCSSSEFVPNCESNPSLYKCCTVLWMNEWRQQSMKSLTKLLIDKHDIKENSARSQHVIDSLVEIHNSVNEIGQNKGGPNSTSDGDERSQDDSPYKLPTGCEMIHNLIATPRRYCALIENYARVYENKRASISQRIQYLGQGLGKLKEAKEHVDTLKVEAREKQSLLSTKQKETNAALEEITVSMQVRQMGSFSPVSIVIAKYNLADHDPLVLLELVVEGLEALQVEQLVEAKLELVEQVVLQLEIELRLSVAHHLLPVLLALFLSSFLMSKTFKEDVNSFESAAFSSERKDKVRNFMSQHSASFEEDKVKRSSSAIVPLWKWLNAQLRFSDVYIEVQPLEREARQLEDELSQYRRQLTKLEADLNELSSVISEKKANLNKGLAEAAQLELDVKKAEETIESAQLLVGKLEDEFVRWNEQMKELEGDLGLLPQKALLASAFLTYLSGEPEDVRTAVTSIWTEIVYGASRGQTGSKSQGQGDDDQSQEFNFKRFLSSESEQLVWKSKGLPSDNLSLENAIVILQLAVIELGASLRPFMIDPSKRASEFLKTHLKDQRLEVVNQQDSSFANSVELAVRFGKTLVIQEVDTVEPLLIPILRGDLISQGARKMVLIGDKLVDYNPEFRLFLTTRNPQPELPPDVASVITEVNFTTTRAGLEGQLLGVAIKHEKPELEERQSHLLEQEENLKLQLVKLEDALLESLATAEGNLLENKQLIDSLARTKESSTTISESLKESQRLQNNLAQERNAFLPLAKRASRIYFIITDLHRISNMYKFSLASFLRLFQRSLEHETPTEAGSDSRILSLERVFLHLVFDHVSQSLLKADRLTFAMHLAHLVNLDKFQPNEWEVFTRTASISGKVSVDELKWIMKQTGGKECQQALMLMKSLLPSLYNKLSFHDESTWGEFWTSDECEKPNNFPLVVAKSVTDFQKLLVVQALRPDRLESAMKLFAAQSLQLSSLHTSAVNMEKVFPDTLPSEPILFVVSPGADPSRELQELVDKVGTIDKNQFYEIAMGQGQSEIAMNKLRHCASNGEWLCLKNVHLVTAWLPTLEKELNSLSPHENFRLFLTAEPHPNFPTVLLQSCLKLTYESPPGVRSNMERTFQTWTPQYFAKGDNPQRCKALFALAWFHAIVEERRSYIPQGWTKAYEFSFADLRSGADIITNLADQGGKHDSGIQWDFVHGLFKNAIYGGRVDNNFDMKVLESYLKRYFNSNLTSGGQLSDAIPALPSTTNIKSFQSLISKLGEDKPSFFGLPLNIERSAQVIKSGQVIGQLKLLVSLTSTETFQREKWNVEISPFLNHWKNVLQREENVTESGMLHQIGSYAMAQDMSKDESPVSSFVKLERHNSLKLISTIHQSLTSLAKVLKGKAIITSDTRQLASALLKRETPTTWLSLSEGPLDPLDYLSSVVSKAASVEKWYLKVKSSASNVTSLFRDSLDLSDLFNPAIFLNAFRQQAARDLGVSMDSLELVCDWSDRSADSRLTLKVKNLNMEGASLMGFLRENQQNSPTMQLVKQTCTLSWTQKSGDQSSESGKTLSLPLYSSTDRDSLVTCLDVPCDPGSSAQWIEAGVALFLRSRVL